MAFDYKITATVAPDDLATFGPLVPGRVALPTSRNPKDGIEGLFLIDTGATNFSIDQSVADDLGLTSSRTVVSHGLGGAVPTKCYQVMVFIPAKPIGNYPPQATAMLGFPQEVGSVSLRKYHEGLGKSPGRIIGVLGRNLLQFTRMTYEGLAGTVTVEADGAAMQRGKRTP
jgi:Aspartyl protease